LIRPANEAEDEPCEEPPLEPLEPVDPVDPADVLWASADGLGFALVADALGVLEAVAVVGAPLGVPVAETAVVLAPELVLTAAYPVATFRCGVEPMATLAITATAARVAAATDPISHFRPRPPSSGPRWVALTLRPLAAVCSSTLVVSVRARKGCRAQQPFRVLDGT
jgi:hypothetical protein